MRAGEESIAEKVNEKKEAKRETKDRVIQGKDKATTKNLRRSLEKEGKEEREGMKLFSCRTKIH
jgi:hypothetical protein